MPPWSHVHNQNVGRTLNSPATARLARVGRCFRGTWLLVPRDVDFGKRRRPAGNIAPRRQAAWWRGGREAGVSGAEHRSTETSSAVADSLAPAIVIAGLRAVRYDGCWREFRRQPSAPPRRTIGWTEAAFGSSGMVAPSRRRSVTLVVTIRAQPCSKMGWLGRGATLGVMETRWPVARQAEAPMVADPLAGQSLGGMEAPMAPVAAQRSAAWKRNGPSRRGRVY